MSEQASDPHPTDFGDFEGGFGAIRNRPEDREPSDFPHSHFAAIYETEEERFAATVPFIREGLAAGERCLYVLSDYHEEEVLEILRECGIDVDAALESGAFSFSTVDETYLQNRPFDPDEMISFYRSVVTEANEEYEGLRVIAGTNWIQEVSLETFMEYEGRGNTLFNETDSRALCLYDRDEHSSEVIADVIRTHPHLIYDSTISQNFYYTPANELFETQDHDAEVERMLETLNGRARAESELADHKRFLQELNEITSRPDRSFEEKLHDLLDLGCNWFDLELGALNRVDPNANRLEVEYINGHHDYYQPGADFPLSQTYCIAASDIKQAASVSDPTEEGFDDLAVYQEFGVESYLGTYLPIQGGADRTFAFIAASPREEPFSTEDRTYIELMGQWVKYELERQQYEAELEETIGELRQSNDRLKQFAYAASHDLQEPLRMVSSYLQLLEERYGDDFDENAQQYVDFAIDGADRMREMVDDLLAFSRVEQSEEEFEPVNCETVIEQVTSDLAVQIEESDPEIVVGSLPTVIASLEQLKQLFSNLISNALKYNESETPRIEISAEERPDYWEFVISDNGIGIDPTKTDRIFEVFKRLHHNDDYPGTGIGLSLCQEIVGNHDGDIWVDSEPGEGSTFTFTLPKRRPS
ncbi:MEDS domain-containing protein [Natrinema halophilum]|uniref:histidine kinase n=1 Tax=Natrinema halophilum TaxID=1699371 RepID=A0A7D5GKW7_9EURY|nr:MEDS domain-containing protein [Natrinema halophilum]QLG49032.1 MEDS domain-containing protein [Natrinema halophilum]